jgi:hypothetical protein
MENNCIYKCVIEKCVLIRIIFTIVFVLRKEASKDHLMGLN